MSQGKLFLFFLFLSIGYFSCGPSTKIEKSWTDPSFTSATAKPFNKALVVALLKDESTRRIAEDKMVAQFPQGRAVQSYNYLSANDTQDTEKEIADRLKKEGFDGVVVMRLANVDKTTSYVPGNTYGGWYGYYRYAAPMYYNNGYYTTDKTYYVETNIYSLESNKMLWSGMTSTVNPSKADKMVDDIISTVKEQMKKEGLVKK